MKKLLLAALACVVMSCAGPTGQDGADGRPGAPGIDGGDINLYGTEIDGEWVIQPLKNKVLWISEYSCFVRWTSADTAFAQITIYYEDDANSGYVRFSPSVIKYQLVTYREPDSLFLADTLWLRQ